MKTFLILVASCLLSGYAFCQKQLHLDYSTFIGGSGDDYVFATPSLDKSGILYLAGNTTSPDFPVTKDAIDTSFNGGNNWGAEDMFLLKFNTKTRKVEYSTFFGSSNGPEIVEDILVDKNKNIYLTGNSGSSNYPVTNNALCKTFMGPNFRHADGILSVFDPKGKELLYSTFIGGSGNDGMEKILSDNCGNVILFGNIGNIEGFVVTDTLVQTKDSIKSAINITKISTETWKVISSSVVPNSVFKTANILPSGYVVLTGITNDPKFKTVGNVYDSTYNGGIGDNAGDLFVMKLSPDLDSVCFLTLLGGSGNEGSHSVVVLNNGDICIHGSTNSSDFPITNAAFDKKPNDLYFAILSDNGKRLKYSTYLGGDETDYMRQAFYDQFNHVYLTGSTNSQNFPVTPNAFDKNFKGGDDLYLTIFNTQNNTMEYSTYLGGTKEEWWQRIVFENENEFYIIGRTNSDDFPNHGNNSIRKGNDIFISRFRYE